MVDITEDFGAETETQEAILIRLVKKKSITGSDVAALRNTGLTIGLVSRRQAEQMFAVERGSSRKCRAWSDFFVETLVDHVVWGERPTGVLTQEAATWLIGEIGAEPTPACLALLVVILEEASAIPAGFQSSVRDKAMRAFAGTVLDAAA